MSETSMRHLSETLRRKTREDRERIEALTQSELDELRESLRRLVSAAVSSTADDIDRELRPLLQRHRLRSWTIAFLAATLVLLAQVAIEGGLPSWLAQEIRSLLPARTPEALASRSLSRRGVLTIEAQDGRLYLILPPGAASPPVFRGQPGTRYSDRWIVNLGE